VARERDRKLIGTHAYAVVAHANEADAAALDIDIDAVCIGIQGVFHELLDDRRRTLDHFTGSNLIDEFVGENPDRHDDTLTDSGPQVYSPSGQAGRLGSESGKTAAQLRKAGAGGRIGGEEGTDAAENGARKLVLLRARAQAALFLRI